MRHCGAGIVAKQAHAAGGFSFDFEVFSSTYLESVTIKTPI